MGRRQDVAVYRTFSVLTAPVAVIAAIHIVVVAPRAVQAAAVWKCRST